MINIMDANKASIKSFNQRTKNLQDAIEFAISQGKTCCYIQYQKTNSIDVLQLEELGYETNIDVRSDLWVYWRM